MNTPTIIVGEQTYYVNVSKEMLVNTKNPENTIRFSELDNATSSLLRMFYIFT